MKNVILIFISLNSLFSFSQKTEFGITLEGGIPMLSNKNTMIQKLNQDSYAPIASGLIHPNALWNVGHLTFDVYPKPLPNTAISVGIRMFKWGWEIDTLSGSFYTPSGWEQYLAQRKYNRGYFLPTLSVGHSFRLSEYLSVKPFISVGLFGVGKKVKQTTFAHDQDKQDFFDYYDFSYTDFSIDFEVFDFEFGSAIKFDCRGFSITMGLSYYRFSDTFYGKMLYNGLHLNGGIGYRFSRKEK